MNKRTISQYSIEGMFYTFIFIVGFVGIVILSWIWYFINLLFGKKIIIGREPNGEWLKSLPVGTYIYLGVIERENKWK
jgi:hypothetical protein